MTRAAQTEHSSSTTNKSVTILTTKILLRVRHKTSHAVLETEEEEEEEDGGGYCEERDLLGAHV